MNGQSQGPNLPIVHNLPRTLEFPLFLLTCGAPQPLGWVFPLWEPFRPGFTQGSCPLVSCHRTCQWKDCLEFCLRERRRRQQQTTSVSHSHRIMITSHQKMLTKSEGMVDHLLDRYRLLEVTHLDRVHLETPHSQLRHPNQGHLFRTVLECLDKTG